MKEFIIFNLNKDMPCPTCKERFKPSKCGLTGCHWMFKGHKEGSGSTCKVMSDWHTPG